jgi:hypothetical protein
MSVCYELLITPRSPPSSLSTYGYSIYPVNIDPAGCMSAPAQNPDGMPIAGHFIGLNTAEYESFVGATATITNLTLETIGIDPLQIAYVFSWGLGSVLSIWALGYAVGAAVLSIKKI